LIDRSPALIEEWKKAFSAFREVEPIGGDYFQKPAAAIVSPANSFGIMDGGLDLAIRDRLGYSVQGKIQEVIAERYHGELPVSCAEIVKIDHEHWKYIIAAPTMRVPESVAHTINGYLAFRAILLAVENFNRRAGMLEIDSLVCCGLGTGVGGIPPARCAGQMQLAYKSMILPATIGRFESIHAFHNTLRSL
jgi:O-acetyl-ADP-ribose deacetylase (regulator of RNase III)